MMTLERDDSGGEYRCTTGLADLEKVANDEKPVPPEFIDESGTGVTDAFRAYALPLISGEAEVEIGADGLPVYARLTKHMVPKKTNREYLAG
jgi:6-phosphofructokinase 1